MGPLWEKDSNWVWQFHFLHRPFSHPATSPSIIYLITDIVAWVTLNLGDKHDYLIIIMLPNICNISRLALLPSIFNDLLTQWAKETSNSTTKEVHQWPLPSKYQEENYNNTSSKMQNWLCECVCVCVYVWLYALLINRSWNRTALVMGTGWGGGIWILSTSHNDLNNNPDNTHGHKNSVWYGDMSASTCACVCLVGLDYEEQ